MAPARGLRAAEADLLLKNGRVWTGDPADPWAEAVAIRGSRILAVGNNGSVADLAGPHASVIDLRGRLAIPGFNDASTQFLSGSLALGGIDLTGVCSLADMQARVRDYAATHPKDAWLAGSGWQYECFPDHRLPTRQDLDAVVRDRPVFLRAADLHAAWVNSKALQLAGVNAQTHFTGSGQVVADPKTNEPTGCLKDGAQTLVAKAMPEPSRAHKLAALEQGMKLAASLGITSIQNSGGDAELVSLFDELDRERKLTLRVNIALTLAPAMPPDAVERFIELKQIYHGPRLRASGVRLVLDGAIATHSAAMLAPYTDSPAASGRLDWTPEALDNIVSLCDAGGMQVIIRAAGDRAVRMALDAYEYARRENGAHDARPRIERIENAAPADLPRFAHLGVLASVKPSVALAQPADVWERAAGVERLKFAFPWQSLESVGAKLVFSSGWPAMRASDPIRALSAAINRQTPDGKPAGGWVPAQRVSVDTALRASTVNGAYATFDERQKGQIKDSMLADVVVLSRDLFEMAPAETGSARIDLTIFDGKVIYTRTAAEP